MDMQGRARAPDTPCEGSISLGKSQKITKQR